MQEITVYTTEHCGYCERAKALLAKRGLTYTEINLERDSEGRELLVELTGMMTFPQIIIGDHIVGGFTELAAADACGRLTELALA
jgi:glutaredoxin 3